MEAAVRQLLLEVGEDPDRPGLQSTCQNYVHELLISTSGYHRSLPMPPKPLPPPTQVTELESQLQPGAPRLVVHRSSFCSQCEHHMLPFYGDIMVACVNGRHYTELPSNQMRNLVAMFTQRLQVQERISHQVADAALSVSGAEGVMVEVCARHMCMVARGVENHAGATISLATRGVFITNAELRGQVLTAFSAMAKQNMRAS
eukprot:gene9125-16248_t